MFQIAIFIMGVSMIAGAVLAIVSRSLVVSVIAVGVVSLFASVFYLFLSAPDVAMTEASIGAGLSTVIFLYAVKKTRDRDTEND